MAEVNSSEELKIRWKKEKGLWTDSKVCYAGKWTIGEVAWASRTKGETKHYGAYSRLPGLKELLGYYATEKEAMDRVEYASEYWIKNLFNKAASL